MLDERARMMLRVASTLTAEDLDLLRLSAPTAPVIEKAEAARVPAAAESSVPASDAAPLPTLTQRGGSNGSPGERERQRTRESKISTACVGSERPKHEWWPVGTQLVGQIGLEMFTATVVENPRVKSGRSILITFGPVQGTVCITPTRAAMEATEAYRQANNLGRSGGVTNGWLFWKARSDLA